jgi:HEAT repeat protein
VRRAAVKALRRIRGNTDAVAVVPLLGGDAPAVLAEAALTAGALREPAAAGSLLGLLQDPEQPALVRRNAAWALGMIGDRSGLAVLSRAAEDDPSLLVRSAARVAQGRLR